jgi:hypothetical protein
VEPAGRDPCCLRSPPVAGRRPLGVSRERRYHRTIQPRTHACRYGERHHRPGRRAPAVVLVSFIPEGRRSSPQYAYGAFPNPRGPRGRVASNGSQRGPGVRAPATPSACFADRPSLARWSSNHAAMHAIATANSIVSISAIALAASSVIRLPFVVTVGNCADPSEWQKQGNAVDPFLRCQRPRQCESLQARQAARLRVGTSAQPQSSKHIARVKPERSGGPISGSERPQVVSSFGWVDRTQAVVAVVQFVAAVVERRAPCVTGGGFVHLLKRQH